MGVRVRDRVSARGQSAQLAHLAQHLERRGSAVHQVADQPEAVRRCGEADEVEQLAELGVAALDVADRVVRHEEKGDARIARPSRLFAHVAPQ